MLITNISQHVATITLNNPKKHNALCEEMVQAFIAALMQCTANKVRVVILRAAPGAKVWCAGHDIDELPQQGEEMSPLGWRDSLRKIVREIEKFSAPVIAMIEGSVWGGGCELAFACDIILAAEKATFAATPAKMGVPYNANGLITYLNMDNLRLSKEMLFTADVVPAERLYRLGMINHLLPTEQLETFTLDMAGRIAKNAPLTISVIKEQLRVLSSARTTHPESFERIQGLRRIVYNSRDYQEGINAFREKRPPQFLGE